MNEHSVINAEEKELDNQRRLSLEILEILGGYTYKDAQGALYMAKAALENTKRTLSDELIVPTGFK